jgi:predicted membrane-bound mannosyltransferase
MFSALRRWLPICVIALIALWLRTHDLAARPMHADEANQAVKFGQLLETGRYAFDPRDHHGPTLYYAAIPIAWLRGQHTLAELDETTVRLVPALFGTFAAVLLYLLASPSRAGLRPAPPQTQNPEPRTQNPEFLALAAAAFVATSSPAVYYSRYFIQETLLATFVLAALVCAQRWWLTGRLRWAISAGACIGLAAATKITAPIFLLAAAIALLFARPLPPRAPGRVSRAVLAAIVAALVVAALLYSSFGTNLSGLRDAFAALGYGLTRAGSGATGHEKPWWYYLRLFGWHRDGGLLFQQIAFSALALLGALLAFARRNLFLRWAAASTAIVAIVLSATPYKTPWHAIHLVPGLALLAAGTLAAIPKLSLSLPLAAVALAFQIKQTDLVAFLRPADARNPYAYVHSSPDVLQFRARAAAALASRRSPAKADAPSSDDVIRVISEEYWPLPWYFRGLPRVGYWNTPPADCDGALVIASTSLAPAVRARLHGTYTETLLGLRPGFLLVVFTPKPSH